MLYKNIFATFVIVLFLFGVPDGAQAQAPLDEAPSGQNTEIENTEDPNAFAPEVYVHDITLEQAAYRAGEMVKGRFTITNVKENVAAADIRYQIELVGNFTDGGFPQTIFSTAEIQGPFTLAGLGKRVFTFEYQLPEAVPSEDLGIQVQTYLGDGRPAARGAVQFAVTGPVATYLQHIVQMQVDGEPYGMLEGPTVYEGELVHFAASLKNTGGEMTVTPTVEIYDRLVTGRLLESFEGETITVSAARTSEQRIELPTYNYTPGIYTVVVTYRDADGYVRSGPHEGRYIVAGTEPTIESLTVDRVEVPENEQFTVAIIYADVPVDIRFENREDTRSRELDTIAAEVEVYDARGELVGNKRVFFERGKQTATVSFTAPYALVGMFVRVGLLVGQEVADIEEKTFTAQGSLVVPPSEPSDLARTQMLLVGGGVLVIFIVVISLVLASRRKESVTEQEL